MATLAVEMSVPQPSPSAESDSQPQPLTSDQSSDQPLAAATTECSSRRSEMATLPPAAPLSLVGTLLVVVAWGALAAGWHQQRTRQFPSDDLGRRLSETPRPIVLEAVVQSSPRWSPAPPPDPLASFPPTDETRLELEVRRVRGGQRWEAASGTGRARVAGRLVGIASGDRVLVYGQASTPRRPLNPGESDLQSAERAERRTFQLQVRSADSVRRLEASATWWPARTLDRLRQTGEQRLHAAVGPRHGGLAVAILLGSRERLDDDVRRGFFLTGLAHLLAISGLNVAIFAYGFWMVARLGLFPRRLALVLAGGLALFYAALAGGDPPVLRAAILVACICLARLIGRQGMAYNALAAAALIVLAINPAHLFQPGAQLSFLAVAILSHSMKSESEEDETPAGHAGKSKGEREDPVDRLLRAHRPWWRRAAGYVADAWWDATATSSRVWTLTLPLVAFRFHLVSPIALLLNPLAVLPMAVALYAGFGVLLAGDWFPTGAACCGRLCAGALELIVQGLALAERIPGGHGWTPGPPLAWLLAWFVALAVVALWSVHRATPAWLTRGRAWLLVAVWFGIGLWLSGRPVDRHPSSANTLSCTFLAVGHGTCVLLELPDGRVVLYDCGRMGAPGGVTQMVSSVLWSRGVRHIDAVVVSHADTDHYNGLPGLLERFSVGVVYVSPVMFRDATPPLRLLRGAIDEARVPCRELHAGMRLGDDARVRLEVLHPSAAPTTGSDNSHSIVLEIEFAGRRILLPGDLESPGLEELLAEEPRTYDVIMAPHHGSQRSDPHGFAAWSTPSHVVISGSATHDTSTVEQTYRRQGAEVWHAARTGAIEFRIQGQ